MKTVAIVAQRGKKGKTSIAAHLAACAKRAGKTAVIIGLERTGRRKAETPKIITATPEQLPGLLKAAKKTGADFAIVDTMSHSNRAAVVAAELADLVLIPDHPSAFDDKRAIRAAFNFLALNKSRAAILLNAVPLRGTKKGAVEARLSEIIRIT